MIRDLPLFEINLLPGTSLPKRNTRLFPKNMECETDAVVDEWLNLVTIQKLQRSVACILVPVPKDEDIRLCMNYTLVNKTHQVDAVS